MAKVEAGRYVCPECLGDHSREEHDAHELHHQRLKDAVVEAAKAWAITPDDYIARRESNAYENAKSALQDATDELLKFEQEHNS